MRNHLLTTLNLLAATALLLGALLLATRQDSRALLRDADAAFVGGRYAAAAELYRRYLAAEPADPRPEAGLAMVATLRGDLPEARERFGRAIVAGLRGEQLDAARLYQARIEQLAGRPELAAQYRRLVDRGGALGPIRLALDGEAALLAAQPADAAAQYRAAAPDLPQRWRELALQRLRLLDAQPPPAALVPPERGAQLLLEALRPRFAPIAADDLGADPLARGMRWLAAGFPRLAADTLAQAPPSRERELGLGYSAWLLGDLATAQSIFAALAAAEPQDVRLAALARLTALDGAPPPDATDAPGLLVRAAYQTLQRNYPEAAQLYDRALAAAPPPERGHYALAAARFRLDAGIEVCGQGLRAAEEAGAGPPDRAALVTLAAVQLACGKPAAGEASARAALAAASADPEGLYLLGRALVAQGRRDDAAAAFRAAADSAPASQWRRRAEEQLAAIGR